jgi:peptidylprolyl isomerase
MRPINKYEATGIFLSIAIMAIALALVRFENSALTTTENDIKAEATVVAANDNNELGKALEDSVTLDGELVRLVIDDVRLGTEGESVESGDTLVVHYIGTTRDGVQFDSSYARGEPFTFTVGAGKVIKGWEEGLIGMKVGGQRILVIPSEMAYGNRQVGPIPPNSPLVFAVELLEIK